MTTPIGRSPKDVTQDRVEVPVEQDTKGRGVALRLFDDIAILGIFGLCHPVSVIVRDPPDWLPRVGPARVRWECRV